MVGVLVEAAQYNKPSSFVFRKVTGNPIYPPKAYKALVVAPKANADRAVSIGNWAVQLLLEGS